MAEAELGGGAADSLSDGGYRPSRLRHLRRRASGAVPLLVLCAVLVAIGVAIASVGQTRLKSGAIPPRAATASTDEATRPARATRSSDEGGVAKARPLVTEGVSLQVLNATGWRRADIRVARRLERLGFVVAALNPAAKRYLRTTVFWSRPEGRRAAEALAARFGWRVGRKPANLSASVTAHVVVGRDSLRR
jgi:hypothetical protein